MPIPSPHQNEDNNKFVARCMGDENMKKDYKDPKQRVAICLGQTKKSKNSILANLAVIFGFVEEFNCVECGEPEPLTFSNLVVPNQSDYIDAGEQTEDYDISHIVASEYQGRKVTLNKPFRTPDGPKKFSVYVKNNKGNVVKVNFGDPNMTIKKNIPERRKSFRARHKCDQAKDKTTPRYWSCKMW